MIFPVLNVRIKINSELTPEVDDTFLPKECEEYLDESPGRVLQHLGLLQRGEADVVCLDLQLGEIVLQEEVFILVRHTEQILITTFTLNNKICVFLQT